MAELDGGDISGGASDEDDDIARFERQCAERARLEGLPTASEQEPQSEEEDEDQQLRRVRLLASQGPGPRDGNEWQQKCELLQEKVSRREGELAQVRKDLDMLRSEGVGPGDPNTELKQRLIDLNKKNRRLQVTTESQKSRIKELETEVKKPKDEARRKAEEAAMQSNAAMLGEAGFEDWKNKYLVASNKLQESRHEIQDLRANLQRHKKVFLKELGPDEGMYERALHAADDPHDSQWKGRAAQVAQLQRQVRELREQLKRGGGAVGPSAEEESNIDGSETPQRVQGARGQVAEKERTALAQAAEKRREEFERLQEETERMRAEQAEAKKKEKGLRSRNLNLERQLGEMKNSIQDLIRKSDNDDKLVIVLQRQLHRRPADDEVVESCETSNASAEALQRENMDLRQQVERQAQIVLQLKQKSLASTYENGSARLGPKSVEGATSDRQLVERVRYLEAENVKQSEQVRVLRDQLGEDAARTPGGRPFSAESSMNLKDKLRQMGERLAAAERENLALRQQRSDDFMPEFSPSGQSSRSNSFSAFDAGMGPDTEPMLRHKRPSGVRA